MRKWMAAALLAAGAAGGPRAQECAPCETNGPATRWITVTEVETVAVPAQEWIVENVERTVTVERPVVKTVEVPVSKVVEVEQTVLVRVPEEVEEEYVDWVDRPVARDALCFCTQDRVVADPGRRENTRKKTAYVCDPCARRGVMRHEKVRDFCLVPAPRIAFVQVPSLTSVETVETLPVPATRKVTRYVEQEKVVKVQKTVIEMQKKEVTMMVPVRETRLVPERKCITTMRTVERPVTRRVQVPCD